ncbi:hypothetical protein BJF90_03750 [Pseudonocardia sp. CNS-004]|nr:hypothetical protein BJF90_03750 [Pseudonocardia sp. CNS-004]
MRSARVTHVAHGVVQAVVHGYADIRAGIVGTGEHRDRRGERIVRGEVVAGRFVRSEVAVGEVAGRVGAELDGLGGRGLLRRSSRNEGSASRSASRSSRSPSAGPSVWYPTTSRCSF